MASLLRGSPLTEGGPGSLRMRGLQARHHPPEGWAARSPAAPGRTCRLQMKACWVVGSARAAAASGLRSGTACRPNTSSARARTCGRGAQEEHGLTVQGCMAGELPSQVFVQPAAIMRALLPPRPPSRLRAEHARVVQVAKLSLNAAAAHQFALRRVQLVSNGGQVQLAAAGGMGTKGGGPIRAE